MTREVEALVVGAGPAGTVAAVELARRGVDVLLVGPGGNGRHSYDAIISEAALHTLTALDVEIPARPVETIELRLGDRGRNVLTEATAAVADRHELDDALLKAALDSGAEWVADSVSRCVQQDDGALLVTIGRGTVLARHVIVATGAGRLSPDGLVCVQRWTGIDPDRVTLTLPAPRTIDPREKPACVWAAPGAVPGTCTIGAAHTGSYRPDELIRMARSSLAAQDPRIVRARPLGPPVSGSVSTSFAPAQAVTGGRLLAGDAAGLVNPFTGEGLSYALQSGLLAGQAVAGHLDDPNAAARSYRRKLSRTFVGYFETARHAAHRYHLAWRMLTTTADSNRPVFAKVRRAVLLPEGFTGLTATERMNVDPADLAVLAPFLLACDEVAISVVREDWPFIARLLIAGEDAPDHRIRPAAPFLGALWAAGNPPDITRATLAAAIELATLGALTFLGPMPAQPKPGRIVDWSLTSTVLAGDFLLGQASRLVADTAPEISWSFADWLAELAALRAKRIHPDHHSTAGAVFASLLEFPARIGAQLGGATPEVVEALRTFGEHCGHTFLHAEDLLALLGRRTRLDVDLQSLLGGRLSTVPDLISDTAEGLDALKTPTLHREASTAVVAAGTRAYETALSALEHVPHGPAARILRAFLEALAEPLTERANLSRSFSRPAR